MLCNTNELFIRYGETIKLAVTYDDPTITTGTFYAGKSGDAPIIEKAFTLTNGAGTIELTDTETSIPLGTYNYSIVIDGAELPSGSELPQLTITESVKNIEAVS